MSDVTWEYTHSSNGDERIPVKVVWEDKGFADFVAEDCAKHFYEECDGWEAAWPIDIEVFADGESCGRFRVEQEAEPTFSARKINTRKGGAGP
jgi:hypothetical protein